MPRRNMYTVCVDLCSLSVTELFQTFEEKISRKSVKCVLWNVQITYGLFVYDDGVDTLFGE